MGQRFSLLVACKQGKPALVANSRYMRVANALDAQSQFQSVSGAQVHVGMGFRAVYSTFIRTLVWNRNYIGNFLARMPKAVGCQVCNKRLANDQLW
jgi:hypothetical protein